MRSSHIFHCINYWLPNTKLRPRSATAERGVSSPFEPDAPEPEPEPRGESGAAAASEPPPKVPEPQVVGAGRAGG